jgi:hypothetical protein
MSERDNFAMYFETYCALTNFDIVYCKVTLQIYDDDINIGLGSKMKREHQDRIHQAKENAIAQYHRRMMQAKQTET